MTVQNAPYIEVDTNNSTPLGVMQTASQNYVNSIDKLGSIFGSMKSNFQDRWYSDALKQSMQYDNADDYGKALSDGSIDLSGLSAEQILSLNRRKKEIAETQLANLQAKEEDIKYRQQAADDKFFTEHPEAAATVARLREQALATGDFTALNQYISDLGQSEASHRVLKELNADSYSVRKERMNIDLKRLQASAALRQADAQIKLTNMTILDKKSDQVAAIVASELTQAGINQSSTNAGPLIEERLRAYSGGDPELYALLKTKIKSLGFDVDTADIANLKTAGTGLSDSTQVAEAIAGRTQTSNKGLVGNNPIDKLTFDALDQNSDGTYKKDSKTFSKEAGVYLNGLLTNYKNLSSEIDNLALQTGNFDAIRDENKREAAKAVKARPSIENFGKLVKQEFPSMPDAHVQRAAAHLVDIYAHTNSEEIKNNPYLLIESMTRNIESDYLPGNITSVSLGEGSHRKVNLSNSLGSDVIEGKAAGLGWERIAASEQFDALNTSLKNLEVYLTKSSDSVSRYKPRSLSDANNPNGRADILSDLIKADDAAKQLANLQKKMLKDSKEKQEELNNLKKADFK